MGDEAVKGNPRLPSSLPMWKWKHLAPSTGKKTEHLLSLRFPRVSTFQFERGRDHPSFPQSLSDVGWKCALKPLNASVHSGSGSRPAPLIGRTTDGMTEQRDFTSCDSTPSLPRATPAVTSTPTSRLAFRPPHCCSFIVKYGPRITGSLAWKPHRKATCMHTPKPRETGKEEMGWDAKCVRVCLPACTRDAYLSDAPSESRSWPAVSLRSIWPLWAWASFEGDFAPNFPHSADSLRTLATFLLSISEFRHSARRRRRRRRN